MSRKTSIAITDFIPRTSIDSAYKDSEKARYLREQIEKLRKLHFDQILLEIILKVKTDKGIKSNLLALKSD